MSNFPTIQNISEVLPFIQGIDSFKVMERKYGTIIDYIYVDNDTFKGDSSNSLSAQIRLECRGLAFDKSGKLISRPLHKFFNVGEREQTLEKNIDWSRPHLVMEKLDGSMVRSMYFEDGFRLGTRAGVTGHSCAAEDYMVSRKDIQYRPFMDRLYSMGYTCSFEFFSRKTMIVIDYQDSFMKLLACRHINHGHYMDYDQMVNIANQYNVPVVNQVSVELSEPSAFLAKTKLEKESEGYIIRFNDGQTVKVKNDWYVQLHSIVSGLNQERNIVRHLLDNELDDILPKLPESRRDYLEKFSNDFWVFYKGLKGQVMKSWSNVLESIPEESPNRKDFALAIKKQNKNYQYVLFRFLDADEQDRESIIKEMVYKSCLKEQSFDNFCSWSGLKVKK